MSYMWLVNPGAKKSRKKPGKKRKVSKTSHPKPESKVMAKAKRKTGKKRRSAAQKAATNRMLAARGHKRTKRSEVRGKKRRVVKSHRSTVAGMPVTERGKVRARKRKIKGYGANPLRSRRRKHARRSNPLSLKAIPQTIGKVAMPVAGGVIVSILADKAMAKLPIPDKLQEPGREKMLLGYTVGMRGLGIVAAMLIGRKFMPKHASTIEGAGIGALTVTATDLVRSCMKDHLATTAKLSGYDTMAGYDVPGLTSSSVNGYDNVLNGYTDSNINNVNSSMN